MPHAPDDPVLQVTGLRHRWPGAAAPALCVDRLTLARGESLFLGGPSGAGKSTLLAAIAGVIDIPPGAVSVDGVDIGALRGGARDRVRADRIGIIFQVFNLVPWLTALENVLLPCRFSERRRAAAGPDPAATAARLLAELGMGAPELAAAPATALSVGQQQRVAAARALIGAPPLILADEPTSALDADAKAAFVDLLARECAASGAALLFVSHDRGLAGRFDRALDLAALAAPEAA